MAKEALFNILVNHFNFTDLAVCDLFAGTGSITFEFASRGAASILAVDNNYKCIQFIQLTALKLGFENVKTIKSDVFRFIEKQASVFDLIFADPPYQLNGIDQIPAIIMESNILKKHGWLILEHASEYNFSTCTGFLENRKYGSVNFSIFSPAG